MCGDLPILPIGEPEFSNLRREHCLYVDKTDILLKLVSRGRWYFLARPRRFGKSLTVSTLKAMFEGRAELFLGLACEDWVKKKALNPSPVLRLDLSEWGAQRDVGDLNDWLVKSLQDKAALFGIELPQEKHCEVQFAHLLREIGRREQVVVLIDEYDAPILGNISCPEKTAALRTLLQSFYRILKSCAEHLRFVFITGIAKFVKTGVFSSLNNLNDISIDKNYGTITGYTQTELETYFSDFLCRSAKEVFLPESAVRETIKKFYDGYSFDGINKVYNPFSILNFFSKGSFDNYWYESGSTTFLEEYCSRYRIAFPDQYRGISIDKESLAQSEIENALPESFLYQAGYLTIVEKRGDELILDYPNQEVLNSLSKMYLRTVYKVPEYVARGNKLWAAVRSGDCAALVSDYNTAIATLPYSDFSQADEFFYRSLFMMLLRGAGIQAHGEVPSCRGRSDVIIECFERVVVIEFKLARTEGEREAKRLEGERQIIAQGYLTPYQDRLCTACVFVVDAKKHQIVV